MKRKSSGFAWAALACVTAIAFAAEEQPAHWAATENDGRIEARHDGTLMFAWQKQPLARPAGGQKFAGSAFLHPLRTPSGFEWTSIQPTDHLHHFGLWWPWKHIKVDGREFNTWEIQEGQGAHVAGSAKAIGEAGNPEWEFLNRTVIKKPGADPLAVIDETARVGLSIQGDAVVIDVSIRQKATMSPVTVLNYRYSGFSWRGPLSWIKDNSTMITSGGKGRDDANGAPARWVVVTGPTPNGFASVLLMSAATKVAGVQERLRVWDSKAENGNPFVNFNPVMEKSLQLDDDHPAVSNRNYRVIAADHVIDAAAAESEWKKWMGK